MKKIYKPMTTKDSTFNQILIDNAVGKDKTAVQIFKFSVKPKHWWWPFKTKRDKEVEAIANFMIDEENLIEKTMDKLTNLYIYGNENGRDER